MLWLDASVGVTDDSTGKVLTWQDQSPARHVAAVWSGFESPRFLPTALSGLPALQFDGSRDRLTVPDAESLRVRLHDFVLELVVSSDLGPDPENGDGRILFSKQDNLSWPFQGLGMYVTAHRLVAYADQGQGVLKTPVANTPSYDDARVRLVGLRRHGNELSLRVNGTQLAVIPVTVDASGEGFPVRLGGGEAGQFLQGVIGEVVWSQVETDADVEHVERYLLTKYATALASP
jgi:hypothetical protein